MSLQQDFIELCRSIEPGISGGEIARRIGVKPQAVNGRRFAVPAAVAAWNAGADREEIIYVPASVWMGDP